MAQKFSFDVISKVDLQEVLNAVNQATKEMTQRYDFRGTKAKIELNQGDNEIVITCEDEFRLKSIVDMLEGRLVKRNVPLKALNFGEPEDAAAGTVRQKIGIQSGITTEKCKEIVKHIKSLKLKVQATIQDEQVRITGAKKDDLQATQQALKDHDFGIHMEFANYR